VVNQNKSSQNEETIRSHEVVGPSALLHVRATCFNLPPCLLNPSLNQNKSSQSNKSSSSSITASSTASAAAATASAFFSLAAFLASFLTLVFNPASALSPAASAL
jgi:hypothetical protein